MRVNILRDSLQISVVVNCQSTESSLFEVYRVFSCLVRDGEL